MLVDIVRVVSACEACQRSKDHKHPVSPQPVRLSSRPWSIIGIDIVGPFPATNRNNEYIVTVVDHFTRYAEAWSTNDITSDAIASEFIKRIICRYGIPDILVSDRGSPFTSTLAAHIHRALHIKRIITTAYHPQSNGVVERFHGTLKRMLRAWAVDNQHDWNDLLPYALFAYNTSYHTVLQQTPHFINHGVTPRQPIDDVLPGTHIRSVNEGDSTDVHEYARELVDRLKSTYTHVQDILKAINIERSDTNMNLPSSSYNIGDLVYLHDPSNKKGVSAKLKIRWTGPYTVLERTSPLTYRIVHEGRSQTVNIDRLIRVRPVVQTDATDDVKASQVQLMHYDMLGIQQQQH